MSLMYDSDLYFSIAPPVRLQTEASCSRLESGQNSLPGYTALIHPENLSLSLSSGTEPRSQLSQSVRHGRPSQPGPSRRYSHVGGVWGRSVPAKILPVAEEKVGGINDQPSQTLTRRGRDGPGEA